MATVHREKKVVDPTVAIQLSGDLSKTKFWTFVKEKPLKAVNLASGWTFKFPLQKTREGGYDSVSRIDTSDPVLAENLKKAIEAGDQTLREVVS